MQLTLVNQTASIRTYLSGLVSVPASGSLAITSTVFQFALSTDGTLKADITQNLMQISDTVTTYGATDGLSYLYRVTQVLVALADTSGNGITSASLVGKQRLDVNLTSEGQDGATAPTFATQVGGKDANGNLQSFLTDTSGIQYITGRIPLSGSSPSAVSVGVASGLVITANAARRGLILTNTSTGIISFNINGGTAVLRSGITLYPGGHWEMDDDTFTTNTINGIASVAASNLAIQELV